MTHRWTSTYTGKDEDQNPYCTKHVPLHWLSQTTCTSCGVRSTLFHPMKNEYPHKRNNPMTRRSLVILKSNLRSSPGTLKGASVLKNRYISTEWPKQSITFMSRGPWSVISQYKQHSKSPAGTTTNTTGTILLRVQLNQSWVVLHKAFSNPTGHFHMSAKDWVEVYKDYVVRTMHSSCCYYLNYHIQMWHWGMMFQDRYETMRRVMINLTHTREIQPHCGNHYFILYPFKESHFLYPLWNSRCLHFA
jgi:hypothetical protein